MPSCRAAQCSTPPRFSADPSYDSPMLTPSPLRQRAFSPPVHDPEQDDIFLQSPFKSPPPVHRLYPHRVHRHPVPIDDDDDGIFLSPSSAATSPFLPPPTSQPLRTPVKEHLRSKTRSVLKSRQLNAQVQSTPAAPCTGVGTKRKSSAGFSTPLRQSTSTPLSISAANADPASGVAFHRLAPLPALRFGVRTPQSKAETEDYLKGQAETLKRLRIRDMENSDEDWGVIEDDDSAYELEERIDVGTKKPWSNKLPLLSRRSRNQLRSPRKPLTINAVPQKGSTLDEVTESISPGGHILKRRARSRPVSLELLGSVNQTPSPSASSHVCISLLSIVRRTKIFGD
jgi:mitosis inhibitor protein kinase SWE1